jgi:hypothetical protein
MTAPAHEDVPSPTMPIQHRVLIVVLAVQAGWLAYLCSRGWFYQDDFTLLSQAAHQHLTVGYLKQSYNGHLAPGVRLTFWIFAHTTRFSYGPTIAVRVVLQAIATILVFRLLTEVSQSRNVALAITVGYAASPLLVPGTVYLAASIQLLPAQICVLIAYLAHIRHAKSGQLRWSALAGLAMLVGVGFWEKTGVTALLLVVLSLGWLSVGSLPRRVFGLFRDWRGWLLTLVPLGAFTGYYLTHHYATSAKAITAGAAWHLIWTQWSHALWPAVVGGPWQWLSGGQSYFAVSGAHTVVVVLGQCMFVLLVVAGWRRSRWRGLLSWTLPLVAVIAGELLIGIGRYAEFGDIPAVGFSYAFDLAVPTALAVALAFRASPQPVVTTTEPVAVGARHGEPVRRWRRTRLAAGLLCLAVVAGSAVVSGVTFTTRWHKSPAKTYVATLLRSIHETGPSVNLYDSPVSLRVLPFISPDRNLSDLLSVSTAKVAFDVGSPQPQLVNDRGQIVPATFFPVAHQAVPHNSFCPTLVKGTTTVTVPIRPKAGSNTYFLQIDYFEQRPALVTITVKNAMGVPIAIRGNSTIDFGQPLGAVLLPLELGAPAQVSFTSSSDSASVCMSTVTIGVPVATQR